jgi:hypothetical protein
MDEEFVAITPVHVESLGPFGRVFNPFHVYLEGLLELEERRLLR